MKALFKQDYKCVACCSNVVFLLFNSINSQNDLSFIKQETKKTHKGQIICLDSVEYAIDTNDLY